MCWVTDGKEEGRAKTVLQYDYDFENQQNSNQKMYTLQIIFVVLLIMYQAQSQCCLKIQGRACLNCPSGTHLFRGNCIIDVDNCLTYLDGFDCASCAAGYQLNGPAECQLIPVLPPANVNDFTDVVIDPKATTSASSDAYSLSVDYFKSFKPQLKSADAVGAIVRTYKNGTVQVTIQFQDSSPNKYYRGVIQPNLQTFIFKQISFDVIPAPTIIKSTTSITPVLSVDNSVVETIDTRNSAHKQKLLLLEAEAKKVSPFFNAFVSGSMTTYSAGNSDISATYNGATAGEAYSIQGSISKDKKVTNVNVKLISGTSPKGPLGNPLANPSYVVFDPATNEQGYLIAFDFLSVQLPKYNNVTPSNIFKASTTETTTLYKFLFTLSDGSTWEVVISFDSVSFSVTVMSQLQTGSAVRPLSLVYNKIDLAGVYLDFQFLIVVDYANKQSNNKYKDATLKSVERANDDNNNLVKYRVIYEYGGFNWEVQTQINTNNFVASGFQEIKKEAVASKPILGSQTNGTANTTKNATANTTTNTSNATVPKSTTNSTNSTKNTTTTTTTPASNTSTTANNTSTSSSSTPKNTSSSSAIVLPQKIIENVLGHIELSPEEAIGAEFKEIDSLLRSVNSQLTGATYLGAFYTTTSFTRNYKIYYMKNSLEIYEAKLSRDNLRKKTYIVSFVKLS